jgi:hypothetical protein
MRPRQLRGSDHVRSVTPAGTPIGCAGDERRQSLCQFRASRNFVRVALMTGTLFRRTECPRQTSQRSFY